MNIFAIEGHKVKVTEDSAQNGYDSDKKKVNKYLEIDKEYTILYTVVGESSTSVKLKEFPKMFFNSVNFEDIEKQSRINDMLHQDWALYSRYN